MVEIQNISLFKKAAECLVQLQPLSSKINENIPQFSSDIVNNYLAAYLRILKSIPYPLNALEEDIKYVTIGTLMKYKISKQLVMWADSGLYIMVNQEENKALHVRGMYWAMETINPIQTKSNIDIDNYKDHIGYKDFKWVIEQLLNGRSTASYYDEFMPDFVKACGDSKLTLKWEIGQILNFAPVPDKDETVQNRIVDKKNNKQYSIDTFVSGYRENPNIISLSLDGSESSLGKIMIYGYDVYEKPLYTKPNTTPGSDKISRSKLVCINQLFQKLVALKNITYSEDFAGFTGFLFDDYFIFNVQNKLYIGNKKSLTGEKEIARGVTLYCISRNLVFFYKNVRISRDVVERTMYSYQLKDQNIRIASIAYIKKFVENGID